MIDRIARFILIDKAMSRFLREPVSVRGAAATIVTATGVVVVASGVLMRVLDAREYPNIYRGMWWALQTVTTVGYGDVTPRNVNGRVVAAVVMFEGIALLAIVTAAVTSSFVERAQRARHAAEEAAERQEEERLDVRLDDLAARLERVETMLRSLTDR
jgi:voltage-gated potassium channel Kch